MNDDALISLAAGLALEAGAAILAVRKRGFDVVRKEDRSPVTEADHAAEAIIVAGLRKAVPDVPVIAEEEVAGGRIHAPAPRSAGGGKGPAPPPPPPDRHTGWSIRWTARANSPPATMSSR